MGVNENHAEHGSRSVHEFATKHDLHKLKVFIMSLLTDLNSTLSTIDDALDKIFTEIQSLEASITGGAVNLPADAQASLDRLKSVVTAIQGILVTTPTSPTLDSIANVAVAVSSGPQTVNLTGITTTSKAQALTVAAVASDGGSVISAPVVTYTSPAATGSIAFTPVTGATGVVTLTITVGDGVGTAVKVFTVTVA